MPNFFTLSDWLVIGLPSQTSKIRNTTQDRRPQKNIKLFYLTFKANLKERNFLPYYFILPVTAIYLAYRKIFAQVPVLKKIVMISLPLFPSALPANGIPVLGSEVEYACKQFDRH